MATKKVSTAKTQKKAENFKFSTKNIHDGALVLTDNLVEGTLASGAKWQKIMAKALTEGTELFGKQQELALDTLEALKDQVVSGNKRFKKLFGLELPKVKKPLAIKKVVQTGKAAKAIVAKKVKMTTAQVKKAAVKIDKDNLKNIEGVGPKIATLLNKAGIMTFKQLAKTNIKDLQAILDAAGPRYKAHDPKTWSVQAKKLAK